MPFRAGADHILAPDREITQFQHFKVWLYTINSQKCQAQRVEHPHITAWCPQNTRALFG